MAISHQNTTGSRRLVNNIINTAIFIALIAGIWGSINLTSYILRHVSSGHIISNLGNLYHNTIWPLIIPMSNILIYGYNFLYKTTLGLPLFFWLIIAINLYIISILKFDHFRTSINSIYIYYEINKNNPVSEIYHDFKHFIASSYGALTVATISEIIVLLHNYGTPGSIIWMSITILLIGAIQMIEIIINCYFIKKTNSTSCFISIMQYVAHKFRRSGTIKFIGVLAILTVTISFFSSVLFQTEQFANILYFNDRGSVDTFIILGIILVTLFGYISLNYFDIGMRFNYKFIPLIVILYLGFLIVFILGNMQESVTVVFSIIEGIFDKDGMLPGIVSGLVISFARYIYKSSDFEEDHFHIYEECDIRKTIVMYSLESLCMSFLAFLTGTAFLLTKTFPELNIVYGISIQGVMLMFTLIFAFSLIVNEAVYSQFAINHLIDRKNWRTWLMRILLICGIIFGLFRQTDDWVDIADHLSVILLIINITSLFFIRRDIRDAFDDYTQDELKSKT